MDRAAGSVCVCVCMGLTIRDIVTIPGPRLLGGFWPVVLGAVAGDFSSGGLLLTVTDSYRLLYYSVLLILRAFCTAPDTLVNGFSPY